MQSLTKLKDRVSCFSFTGKVEAFNYFVGFVAILIMFDSEWCIQDLVQNFIFIGDLLAYFISNLSKNLTIAINWTATNANGATAATESSLDFKIYFQIAHCSPIW